LELAMDHFESSFETEKKAQAFLSLFTNLEILLQPSGSGFNLVKNAANLLGQEDDEKRKLRGGFMGLRGIRNSIVHGGVFPITPESKDVFHFDSLARLRELVSIILMKVDSHNSQQEIGLSGIF
jgi:hypothetical protein